MANLHIIEGHLGRDAELRSFQDGNSILSFSVATTEKSRTREGEQREYTEWHQVVIRVSKLAQALAPYMKKGTRVLVQGKVETRKWTDQSGATRYSTETAVRHNGVIKLIGGAKRQDGQQAQSGYAGASAYQQGYARDHNGRAPGGYGAGYGMPADHSSLDDSIPF